MKLPQAMIDRACREYWSASGVCVSTEDRIRAALEAALSKCRIGFVCEGKHGDAFMPCAKSWVGKRVALVPLDD